MSESIDGGVKVSDRTELKSRAVKGGVLTITAQIVVISVQLISMVIMSRLLSPRDFGTIAMITAITGFVALFRDMGLSTASIQKGGLTQAQSSMLFWLNVGMGAVLTISLALLAPVVGWFYGRSELAPVTAVLSTSFLISSLGAQHSALLQRQLRFKPKALAEITGACLTLISAVVFGMNGFGYWSLAWANLIGLATTTALYMLCSGFRPSKPARFSQVKEMLGFGADITGFEVVNYFSRNLDSILIGKYWGAIQLGYYSRAYQMMMLPIASLRAPINAVALPVLSKLKDDPGAFRSYYLKIAGLLALMSMPLMAFLTVNAERVVAVALGPNWHNVVGIFTILGITGFIQPVASLRGLVMISLGRSRKYLVWGAINAALVCISFLLGVKWGAIGVAFFYLAVNYIILYPSIIFIFSGTPLRPLDFFFSIYLPGIASITATTVNFIAIKLISFDSNVVGLMLNALLFTASFFLAYLILPGGRKALGDYVALVKILKDRQANY